MANGRGDPRTYSQRLARSNTAAAAGGSFSIKLDVDDLGAYFDALGDKAEKAARPAAQAMAQVFYDEVKKNADALGKSSGRLSSSIYQAFSRSNSSKGVATYHISWNASKAPHAHLVEYGHMQRYATYVGKNGKWYTAVRPEMQGKPKPGRGASQAVKDAYYVTLSTPRQVAAKAFVRKAVSKRSEAIVAAEDAFIAALLKQGGPK